METLFFFFFLEHASKELLCHKKFILSIIACEHVKFRCLALKYAALELQDDQEVVHAAVKQASRAIQYASDRVKHNKEIVQVAVQANFTSLQFVPDEMKDDKHIM
jgi:hypothetical protein